MTDSQHIESNGHSGQNKTDAGNGSYGICRVIDVLRSPSPDPKRSVSCFGYPVVNVRDVSFSLYECINSHRHG